MLAGLLAARVWVFLTTTKLLRGPSGAGFGADLGMFLGAAKVLARGGNPYDHSALYRAEYALLHGQGLLVTRHFGLVRVGNPPLMFWVLHPLAGLSFQPVALAWIAAMWALAAVGFLAVLRYLGWRHSVVPLTLFLVSPQVLSAVVVGNVVPVVVAAIGGALLLVRRRAFPAGILLAIGWLKPEIGVPIALLIVLFHADRPRRVVAGFLMASASLFGFILLTTGWSSVLDWVGGLSGYAHDIAAQVWVSSLASTYYQWAPPALRFVLGGLTIAMACVLTAVTWKRSDASRPVPIAAVAWLWVVWFLATPYAHIDDEIVLAIPVLALLGRDAYRMSEAVPAFALLLMVFTVVRDAAWIPLELALGLAVLALPDITSRRMIPSWWRIPVFGLFVLSVLPVWSTHGIDMESLELAGVAACAGLVAAYGVASQESEARSAAQSALARR